MNSRKPDKRDKKSDHGQGHGEHNQTRIPEQIRVSGKIETDFPPKLVEEYKTANREETSRENSRFIIECVTLVLVIFVAVLNIIQARQSIRTANSASDAIQQSAKQFVLDRRPFVWLTASGIGGPQYYFPKKIKKGDTSPHGQIVWTYHYTDYGKTFAKDMHVIREEMQVGKDSPYVVTFETDPQQTWGTPLPPGKDDFRTAASKPGVSLDEFNKLMSEDGAISVRVKFRYSDTDGNIYETGICLSHLALGATQYCTHDNYMQ